MDQLWSVSGEDVWHVVVVIPINPGVLPKHPLDIQVRRIIMFLETKNITRQCI